MMFLTTYFRTTPMAEVILTSLVTDTPIVHSTVRNFKKIIDKLYLRERNGEMFLSLRR